MARPLLIQLPAAGDTATSTAHAGAAAAAPPLLLMLAAAAAVAALVVSLCTSGKHAKPWKKRVGSSPAPAPQEQEQDGGGRSKRQLLASLSGIGGKAAAVAKMVSWNSRRPPPAAGGWSSDDDGDAAAADEEALWKKTIIMGDKCRPLEFSGHIAYDSDGNQLQQPPPPPPTMLLP